MNGIGNILAALAREIAGPDLSTRAKAADSPTRYPKPTVSGSRYGVAPFVGPEFEQALLYSPTVYAASVRLGRDIAAIPKYCYQTAPDGTEIRVEPEQNETAAIMESVNGVEGGAEFWEQVMLSRIGTGESAVLLDNQGTGAVKELFALRAQSVNPIPGPARRATGYRYSTEDGQEIVYEPEEIWFAKLPNPLSDWRGLSPLHSAQVPIALEIEIGKKLWAFFKNYIPIAGAVQTDQTLGPDQLAEYHDGIKALLGMDVMVNHSGLKWQDIAKSPEAMAAIELWLKSGAKIASVIGVPMSLIGIVDEVKYQTAPEQTEIYWTSTIPGHCRPLEESINENLMPKLGAEGIRYKFDLDSVEAMQDIKRQRAEQFKVAIESGQMTPNEAAEELGYPPAPVGGDQRYILAGLTPIGGVQAAPIAPVNTRGATPRTKYIDTPERNVKRQQAIAGMDAFETPAVKDLRAFFKAQGARVVRRLEIDEGKSLTTSSKGTATETAAIIAQLAILFPEEIEYALIEGLLTRIITRIISTRGPQALASVGGVAGDFLLAAPEITTWISATAGSQAVNLTATTHAQLAAVLTNGQESGWTLAELTKNLNTLFSEDISLVRAARIARTEVTRSYNFANVMAIENSDVAVSKEWMAIMDDVVRDSHAAMDGDRVAKGTAFVSGDGYALYYPGDPQAPPGESINCRCQVVESLEEPTMEGGVPRPAVSPRQWTVRQGVLEDLKAKGNGKPAGVKV